MNHIPDTRRRRQPDFSLTIVNIVFLLLLFYLASGSLIARSELEADAPFTRELPLELLPRPLLLVGADGALFLDGARISMSELPAAINRSATSSDALNILADRSMGGRDFLRIIGQLDAMGREIRIVTLHADGRSARSRP